jgi:hypothetical protein
VSVTVPIRNGRHLLPDLACVIVPKGRLADALWAEQLAGAA